MKIQGLGIDKRATVILGAGASRGAACFDISWAKSPLDVDFFEQADRLRGTPEGVLLDELVQFAREEFGVSAPLSMEPFFTQLESLHEFHTSLKIDRGPRVRAYATQLEKFPKYLACMFRALSAVVLERRLSCERHDALASNLRAGDSVISFNYDCLMDDALRRMAGKSWDVSKGYAVDIRYGAKEWHDHSGRGRVAKENIKLLKVHGSLNWKRSGTSTVDLRSDPYEDADRSPKEIVPPVWDKRIAGDAVLAGVWKAARNALRLGPVLVVIGYSVPETDLLSQVLLRVAPSESGKSLTHLICVNPDSNARRKLRAVLHRALAPKTTVIDVESWFDFHMLLTTPIA